MKAEFEHQKRFLVFHTITHAGIKSEPPIAEKRVMMMMRSVLISYLCVPEAELNSNKLPTR